MTGCVTSQMQPRYVVKKVLTWLRDQESRLVVIDNVDDKSVVDGFLPETCLQKHTLITTRISGTMSFPAEGIEIPMFLEKEALELLRIRSNISATEWDDSKKDEGRNIVSELGYLGLAIDQAAAILRCSFQGISDFLPLFREHRNTILRHDPISASIYPYSIAATFLLTLQRIKLMEYGEEACKLFSFSAFLSSDHVVLGLLDQGGNRLDLVLRNIIQNKLVFYGTLELLWKFSLITRSQNKDVIYVHPIIRAVVKNELTEEDRQFYYIQVVDFCERLESTAEEDGEPNYKIVDQVMEPRIEAAEFQPVRAESVLHKIGALAMGCSYFKAALRICRCIPGKDTRLPAFFVDGEEQLL